MPMRSTPRAIVHMSGDVTPDAARQLQRQVRAALRTRRTIVVAGAQLHVERLPRADGPTGSVERTASRTIGGTVRARSRQRRVDERRTNQVLVADMHVRMPRAEAAAVALWAAAVTASPPRPWG